LNLVIFRFIIDFEHYLQFVCLTDFDIIFIFETEDNLIEVETFVYLEYLLYNLWH